MKVQVLYIDECPNWQQAGALTRRALDAIGMTAVPVEFIRISTESEAVSLGFAGSPTINVDGEDLIPSEGSTVNLACRVYLGEHGLAGTPTLSQLTSALRQHVS